MWHRMREPTIGDRTANPRRLIAHPSGTPFSEIDLCAALPHPIAIGPEGGLTDTEVAAATAAGWQQVSPRPANSPRRNRRDRARRRLAIEPAPQT